MQRSLDLVKTQSTHMPQFFVHGMYLAKNGEKLKLSPIWVHGRVHRLPTTLVMDIGDILTVLSNAQLPLKLMNSASYWTNDPHVPHFTIYEDGTTFSDVLHNDKLDLYDGEKVLVLQSLVQQHNDPTPFYTIQKNHTMWEWKLDCHKCTRIRQVTAVKIGKYRIDAMMYVVIEEGLTIINVGIVEAFCDGAYVKKDEVGQFKIYMDCGTNYGIGRMILDVMPIPIPCLTKNARKVCHV